MLSAPRIDFSNAIMAVRVERRLKETKTDLRPPRTLSKAEWPPSYEEVFAWRNAQLARFELDEKYLADALAFYAKPEHCTDFINHWCTTYDPRNAGTTRMTSLPLVLFEKQDELVQFVLSCLNDDAPGLIEKSRDMGATWVCGAVSVWLWRFWEGTSVGWGSRKQELVDRIGDPDSIFEKIRMLIRGLPKVFLPKGFDDDTHMNFMRIINPANGSTITGEVGDNIGRGGRKRVYFCDESAHYERPEKIQAALSENTRVAIDISSVNGLGNVFHRRRESGQEWYPGAKMEKGKTRVLVLDWRDHPEKDDAWYARKKQKAEDEGLQHLLAQEVDRDYAAAVEGRIIEIEWIQAAVDAHLFLGFGDDGGNAAGLDVADEGGDTNAYARRKGVVLRDLQEWGERDVGVTARRAIANCMDHTPIELDYDSIGVGAGVKSEANRLKLDDPETAKLLRKIKLVPWNAGGAVLNPRQRVVRLPSGAEDDESPRNEDFYQNLKAQGWWEIRGRFYRTWRAVMAKREGRVETYDSNTLISIDSRLKLRLKLEKELAQAVVTKSSKMKLMVDKKPDGTKSPNLADATVICYWPIPDKSGLVFIGGRPKVFVAGEEQR